MNTESTPFAGSEFDAFLDEQRAKYAHVRTEEIAGLIDDLASANADKVRLPAEETEWGNSDAALIIRLEDAAARAPRDDEQAIKRAIYDELDRVLRDYAFEG